MTRAHPVAGGGKPLPARYKDHPLSGEWSHFRDCHIEPWTARTCTSSAPARIPICSNHSRP
ncbi:MAG TPA: type II toxin-antitoxin system mRNA interferase toxin, RelE/StbE family [Candidatus Limnocylindrales bacterium]|nr:type II toxin-antitoxin system mRNA interferase toxin, RelE/StbE family [Candidatus Limnocylindrales bacterium]